MSINSDVGITVEIAPDVEILVDVVPSVDLTVAETSVEIQVGDAPINTISVETPPVIGLTVAPPPENTISVGAPNNVTINVDWAGPPGEPGLPGPPGPTAVSADVDNAAVLGSDSLIFVPIQSGGEGVTDHGFLTGLADDDHPQYLTQARADPRYVNTDGDKMTGLLEVPDLKISGGAEPGLVWTAEALDGTGGWQEPSALVVAETSDPVLINWFDNAAEGWVQYFGDGTMAFTEMNSPSMPGVLDCTGEVWAEWQAADPMVFEPGALYRVTVRARMDAGGRLAFGFQGYNANTPATVVSIVNSATPTNPHFVAVDLAAGDDAWIDDVTKPGRWLAWTGYISGIASGVAEGVPPVDPLPDGWPPEQPANIAPAEFAVAAASGMKQWRPMFRATGGKVWVDAVEVHRLDRSLELPDGIRVSDVYAQSVAATTVTTENLIIPPSTDGYVLTAVDGAGNSEWQYPPITVTEGPPVRSNMLQEIHEKCVSGAYAAMAGTGTLVFNSDESMTFTAIGTGQSYVDPAPNYAAGTNPVPVEPNTTYTFRTKLTTTGTSGWKSALNERDAAGVIQGTDHFGNEIIGSSGVSEITFTTTANTTKIYFRGVLRSSGGEGDTAKVSAVGLWRGTKADPDAPDNPLAVNLGTLPGRHGGSLESRSSAVTITATTATTRVPGSKALQWTQTAPAMVTLRANTYLGQSANSVINLIFNIGVEDANGTKLLTDSFGAPTTNAQVGGTIFRTNAGGLTYVPGVAFWRRYLPPGTYMAYPVAWCTSIDAGSAKSVGITYLELEIDPGMTNLPGMP